MILHYIVWLISLALGVLVGFIFSTRDSKKMMVRDAVISGTISTTIAMIFSTVFVIKEVTSLSERLVRDNAFSDLTEKIKNKPSNELTHSTLNNYYNKIEDEINQAILGTIKLDDEDEVVTEWKRFFKDANSRSIKATNIIPADFWLEESTFSIDQLDLQKGAIDRDYSIQRIFLYKESDSAEREKLLKLAKDHSSIGIKVKFLSFERIEKSAVVFNKKKSTIFGTKDIVITDENVVLLTITYPTNGKISHGYLSEDRNVVDAALAIYDELWKIADEEL